MGTDRSGRAVATRKARDVDTRWRRFTVLIWVTLLVLPLPAAEGHDLDDCLADTLYGSDPNCEAHWQNWHTYYHWGSELAKSHHSGERSRFSSAVGTWQGATNPDSPWHAHYSSSAPTHPNMVNWTGTALGMGRIAQENGADHIPRVLDLWLRHDIYELGRQFCGNIDRDCEWYTGTASSGLPANSFDAWSVWTEELGHVQNITHHAPAGHGSHQGDHTMSGQTFAGSAGTGKRVPDGHAALHACIPFRNTHGNC